MINFTVTGLEKLNATAANVKKAKKEFVDEIAAKLNVFGNRSIRSSQKDYLSGPRPEKLGVVTGLLRSSIRMKVSKDGDSASMIMGTWVPYARIHEEGGDVPTRLGKGRISSKIHGKAFAHYPARPFLRPAVDDNLDALRDDLKTVLSRLKNGK